MTELGPGHVIAGRYRLERQLGQGGMGSVWSAVHLELRSRVAVKLIVPRHANDPDMLSRLLREARAAALLRSPHVVQIFDSGVDEGLAFIVMEQLEGENLAERLTREGRLSPALTAEIVTHVARALSRAHEANLVHRDIKPENVFLVTNEDELMAKVLDFGIAKVLSDDGEPPSARTQTGRLMGSPYYMSPEQARGRDVDARADNWALGVLAYECLLGERAFQGGSLGEVILAICSDPLPVPSQRGSVPEGFDAWFAKATARDADLRFQSARELAAALRQVLLPGARVASDHLELKPSSGASSPSDRAARAVSVGNTTGTPTSSEVGRAQQKRARRSWWPALSVAAGLAVAGLFAVKCSLAPSAAPPPSTASVARAPEPSAVPASVPAPAAPPVVPAPVNPLPAAAPASAATMPSALPPVATAMRPRAPRRSAPPATPSGAPKVTKDPLSSRF